MEHLDELYYIFCVERQMYWKPNSMGYTPEKEEAGLYTYDQAYRITNAFNVKDQMIKVNEEDLR